MATPLRQRRRGFTLVELLAVVGSVRFLNQEIGIDIYAVLITRDGGEVLDDDKY